MKTTTLLFDCDNTLVLTEHIAFESCAKLANEILTKYGVQRPKPYTGPELMADFVGKNFRGMMAGLQENYHFQMPENELEDYVNREVDEVIKAIKAQAVECEGATQQVQWAMNQQYKMAVVSSSAGPRVEASVKRVQMDKYFPKDRIYSAATSLPEPTSKPNPAIYKFAMQELGVYCEECVAIEDSKSGAGAAVAANIPTIAYVGASPPHERDDLAKKLKDTGCKTRMDHWSEFPRVLKEMQDL